MAVKPWNPVVADTVILKADALGYHQLAKTIVNYHHFTYENGGRPDGLRTPLYPLFISCFYSLFGPIPWIVLLAQIVIDTFSCLLLYSIIRRLLNPTVGFCSALFYSLNPFFIFYCVTLFSDILFVFLCILAFNFFIRSISRQFKNGNVNNISYSALFFGLATLARPIGIYLPLIITVFFLVNLRKQMKKAIKLATVFIVVFLISLSPWLIRNVIVFSSFSLSTSGAWNLLLLNVTPMEMERRNQPRTLIENALSQEVENLIIQDGLNPRELDDFQVSRYFKKLAIQYIKKYPLSFCKHYALGIFHSFANLGTRGFAEMLQLRTNPNGLDIKAYNNVFDLIAQFFKKKTPNEILIGLVIGFYLIISYFCFAIGLLIALKINNKTFLLFSIMIAVYFILITGVAGLARFTLPAIPFYLSFVGLGISAVKERLKGRRQLRTS